MAIYLQVAAFVEGHNIAPDGSLTLFRIFDRLNFVLPFGSTIPPANTDLPLGFQAFFVATVRRDEESASAGAARLERIVPDAAPQLVAETTMAFPAVAGAGANWIVAIQAPFSLRRGVNWFRLVLDGREMSRVPLLLEMQVAATVG